MAHSGNAYQRRGMAMGHSSALAQSVRFVLNPRKDAFIGYGRCCGPNARVEFGANTRDTANTVRHDIWKKGDESNYEFQFVNLIQRRDIGRLPFFSSIFSNSILK